MNEFLDEKYPEGIDVISSYFTTLPTFISATVVFIPSLHSAQVWNLVNYVLSLLHKISNFFIEKRQKEDIFLILVQETVRELAPN